ncbi:MAG TPA: DUF3325 domain-containing protein [Cellvibrio sp.]
MLDGFLLLGAFIATLTGMGWLALAMNAHWKQVCDGSPSATTSIVLRSLGGSALLVSLLLCLGVDHASMASLVWVMLLAASAMSIAFILTWRPRLLSLLVIWNAPAN